MIVSVSPSTLLITGHYARSPGRSKEGPIAEAHHILVALLATGPLVRVYGVEHMSEISDSRHMQPEGQKEWDSIR